MGKSARLTYLLHMLNRTHISNLYRLESCGPRQCELQVGKNTWCFKGEYNIPVIKRIYQNKINVIRFTVKIMHYPANTKHLYKIYTELGQRTLGRRCLNVIQMFSVCWVSAGIFQRGQDTIPANTKHLYKIYTMSGERRRRWADVA